MLSMFKAVLIVFLVKAAKVKTLSRYFFYPFWVFTANRSQSPSGIYVQTVLKVPTGSNDHK